MIFRSSPAAHTHTQAYNVPNVPSIQYSSVENEQHLQPPPQRHLSAPQPTINYARPNQIEDTAVLHAPESTAIPAFQYIIPTGATHHVAAAQTVPLQLPQSIEYALQPQHPIEYHAPIQKPNYLQHYMHHFTPTLDLFGQFNKHPISLLDSYIPSSVVLARQRGIGHVGNGVGRNLLHTVSSPQVTHLIHQGSHQPGYNTIAYSTHQDFSGYAKRSPKLTKSNKKN